MRINSSFKDYYDGCLGLGFDDNVTYQRFEKRVKLERFPFQSFWKNGVQTVFVESIVVGLCGKLHPILALQTQHGDQDKKTRSTRKLCFSVADVDSYVQSNYGDSVYELYRAKHYQKGHGSRWGYYQRTGEFERYFNATNYPAWGVEHDTYRKYFDEHPLFVARCRDCHKPCELVYNTPLKSVEFYRLFDAHQTFQELEMWLNNQAQPRKPIPEISNDDMIESKGFDLKSSFRKEKSKK